MTDYEQLLNAVAQYYGSGSDQWAEIAKYGIASDKAESILSQVPGVNVIKNANGKVRSYNFAPTENIASDTVNSNTPAVIKSFEVPANTGIETVTTPAGETVKQMTFVSGMSKAGNFVCTEVVPALAAASAGITLGKTIDSLLYKAIPDFWDEHGMSTINPDTWDSITSNDTFGGRVFNFVFGLNPDDNSTQAYMDENTLAYMTMYLKSLGIFDTESYIDISNDSYLKEISKCYNIEKTKIRRYNAPFTYRRLKFTITNNSDKVYYFWLPDNATNYSGMMPFFVSKSQFKLKLDKRDDDYTSSRESYSIHYVVNNKDVYVSGNLMGNFNGFFDFSTLLDPNQVSYVYTNKSELIKSDINSSIFYDPNDTILYYWVLYGNEQSTTEGIEGITNQDNAKIPDLSNVNSIEEALNALKEQYPELWQNAVTQNVVQPDGSTVTYTYVPVAIPELDPEGNPISSPALDPEGNPIGSTQANPQIDPATAPEPLLRLITTLIQKDPPINPPDTGSGDTPTVVPASGSASALYAIYNPTLAQINAFGAWLWSDNFIDQIKKLFNDPMQAIIGLHKVYATPATSGSQTIKVGYLDSGVSANVVSNQYTTVDCGTVTLSEYFHNVFDYSPYTQINLYLPFIGIVSLDNADVMRASIHIVYHVDVLSGACLAEVKVTRDGAGGTLYQYTGNASVTLPISSGSYMGIVSSIASIAGGIAGTIASGGAALPMIASAAGSALNARAKVEHSGGFSGNAGAMGGKIPYLIISRPQVALADNFQKYIGFPANYTTKLSACSGFVKVLECHIENVNATSSELTEIETLLKDGIIV